MPSPFFERGADEAAKRLGVTFRDTDPRPGFGELQIESGIRSAARQVAMAEDERLIVSLATWLYARINPGEVLTFDQIRDLIREWRDGAR